MVYIFKFIQLLSVVIVSVVTFAFGVVIANYSFVIYDIDKRIFITMRLIAGWRHLSEFKLRDAAVIFYDFDTPYQFALH